MTDRGSNDNNHHISANRQRILINPFWVVHPRKLLFLENAITQKNSRVIAR
jgi:hypothetical protein